MRRPLWIARHARRAEGMLGGLIASIMAIETRSLNNCALELLEARPGHRVLDIGCGPGVALECLVEQGLGPLTGLDPSSIMLERTKRRNADAIEHGRLQLVRGEVETAPLPDQGFDRIVCIHVMYFWKDLDTAVQSIARLLAPHGRLVVAAHTAENWRARQAFPEDVYRFYPRETIRSAFTNAGLVIQSEKPAKISRDVVTSPIFWQAEKAGVSD